MDSLLCFNRWVSTRIIERNKSCDLSVHLLFHFLSSLHTTAVIFFSMSKHFSRWFWIDAVSLPLWRKLCFVRCCVDFRDETNTLIYDGIDMISTAMGDRQLIDFFRWRKYPFPDVITMVKIIAMWGIKHEGYTGRRLSIFPIIFQHK